MTTMAQTSVTTQVYSVYIRATPEAIWEAITKPEWSRRFGYGGDVEYDLRPGGSFRGFTSPEMRAAGAPDLALDGEVLEADPPHRLVQTWRMMMDQEMAAEGFTKLTYEIKERDGEVTKLTVIHELEGAPRLASLMSGGMEDGGAGGGWNWVLSGLKTLLETGRTMTH
jgi:uncharacterized protein YndB with AHSA1/START domain